ncbi:MAG: hypothetical protein IK119_05145 [Bacteroidales bacterium]|nr:hypothetical protein [Bacteroidales bacterium]
MGFRISGWKEFAKIEEKIEGEKEEERLRKGKAERKWGVEEGKGEGGKRGIVGREKMCTFERYWY